MSGRGVTRPPLPGRPAAVLLGVMLALLAAVGAGAWGLSADRGQDDHHDTGPEWAAVSGGWFQVSDVTTRSMDHKRVPGMATMPDPDPVPSGLVRIRVGVVLAAAEDDLPWSVEEFRLTGRRTAPVAPHDAELGDGVVPAASQVSGGLVFDVPEDATDLRLEFADAALPVEIDLTQHPHDQPGDAPSPSPDDRHEYDDSHEHADDESGH